MEPSERPSRVSKRLRLKITLPADLYPDLLNVLSRVPPYHRGRLLLHLAANGLRGTDSRLSEVRHEGAVVNKTVAVASASAKGVPSDMADNIDEVLQAFEVK